MGAIVLVGFAIAGRQLFAALGAQLEALRGAGGLVLLLTALDMVRGKPARCRWTREEVEGAGDEADVAIVPLAIPLLAGPGAMATVIVLASDGTTFNAEGVTGPSALQGGFSLAFVASAIIAFAAAGLAAWRVRSAAPPAAAEAEPSSEARAA